MPSVHRLMALTFVCMQGRKMQPGTMITLYCRHAALHLVGCAMPCRYSNPIPAQPEICGPRVLLRFALAPMTTTQRMHKWICNAILCRCTSAALLRFESVVHQLRLSCCLNLSCLTGGREGNYLFRVSSDPCSTISMARTDCCNNISIARRPD